MFDTNDWNGPSNMSFLIIYILKNFINFQQNWQMTHKQSSKQFRFGYFTELDKKSAIIQVIIVI